jgi:hypothetical protein
MEAGLARFNPVTVLTNHVLLNVGLRLRKTDDFTTFLPLATLLEKLDPLKALQHVAPGGDGAGPF